LVKALAAGALLAAAALPMAIATAAGAVVVQNITFDNTGASNTVGYTGAGSSGTFDLFDSTAPFAANGGNVTVTSTDAGVTFSTSTGLSGSDVNGTDITGTFTTTAASAGGPFNVTVTDAAGTQMYTGLFSVNADPTVTSVSPTTASDTPTNVASFVSGNPATFSGTAVALTVTGSGFLGSAGDLAGAVLTSTVDGTQLAVSSATTAGVEGTTSATATVDFSLQNAVNGEPATPGTYTLTLINADGGSVTTGALFTVIGDVVNDVSPSSVASASGNTAITINGAGFEQNASVYLDASGTLPANLTNIADACTYGTLSSVTVTSTNTITATLDATGGPGVCDLYVLNNGAGDNGAGFDLAGAIGFGGAATAAPVITSSSLTSGTGLIAGAPATTIVLTGQGFGAFNGTTTTVDPTDAAHGTYAQLTGCVANGAGTTLTCNVFAGDSATNPKSGIEGSYEVLVNGGSLANAFSVTGPTLTSLAPTALAKGAPIGTVIAITGTNFSNLSSGTVTHVSGGDALAGLFEYVSATSMNFVVTTPPSAANAVDSLAVTSVNAYGYSVASAPIDLAINPTPTVSSIAYKATGTHGVGVGATAQTITLAGTGFETGATVGSFVNASGTADANVTAKVTAVTATQITATVAIAAGDTNTIVGYTVTNPDGGSVKVLAIAPLGLTIDAAPTITAVTPSPALPSATNAFTLTGTGFATGAAVTTTPSNGLCGPATVVSATSITVSCSLEAEGLTATALAVTNADGGTGVSPTVLPAATVTPPAPKFHVSAVHGSAVAGKTVTLTISGTGFYGQPRIKSNAAGTKAVVAHDSGKLLTVHVTTKAGVSGEHTFTVTLANGKSGKVNYSIKK
jgi:hypothetical protein